MENFKNKFKKALGVGLGVGMISGVSAEGNLNNRDVSLDKKEKTEISFEKSQNKIEETYQLKLTQEDLDEGLLAGVDGLDFESLDSVPDLKAKYGYKQLGTKKLVGKQRPYFGSEFTGEKSPFFKERTSKDPIQYLGNIFPDMGMDGKAIFYDFGPDGKGHIVELEGRDEVFRDKDGRIYAVVCGNLLKFITTGQENKKPEKEKVESNPNEPEPEPKKESNEDLVRVKKVIRQYNWNNHQFAPATLNVVREYISKDENNRERVLNVHSSKLGGAYMRDHYGVEVTIPAHILENSARLQDYFIRYGNGVSNPQVYFYQEI